MKAAVILVIVALALSACAGDERLVTGPTASVTEPRIALPAFRPGTPAFRIELRGDATEKVVHDVERIAGVVVAAPVGVSEVSVGSGSRGRMLRVVTVEPLSFRSVAPSSTQAADFVWTSLVGGRAVLTPEAARALNFRTSESLTLDGSEIDVGAFADNATPNLGDVMVSHPLARRAGLGRPDQIVVGIAGRADPARVETAVEEMLGSRLEDIHRLEQGDDPVDVPDAVGTAGGELIGSMNFRILKNGFIEPEPEWVAANIAQGSVPIIGTVTCHRLLFPQLHAAFAEIEEAGLAGKIDPAQFGGCYVPRFIDRDPRRGLSAHAFGLAIDLNVSKNLLGTRGSMDRRVVAIFEKWGFAWGGRWSRPDPMHFELARLLDP